MALSLGARLGPYEILSALGAGGMGEVYRARDTKLGRDVALKILPDAFASDPDRLARFQREAHVLASLNHPNIAAIHGLEDADGVHALVMELVEGPTLAEVIAGRATAEAESLRSRPSGSEVALARGGAAPRGLELDEALPIAKQIAEALEAAHEQGIIHRDLKPANIKVRPDGTVKVLDFGLAKAIEPAWQAGTPAGGNLANSPTITSPAMMTGIGMILGTAAYMAPEQARGRAVDKRADIWAFGCVLYEMLTGRKAFDDEDVSMTLSKVLQREPDFSALGNAVPARVRQTLAVCLRKDPRQRAGDIHDVWLALEGSFETPILETVAPVAMPQRRRVALPSAASLLAGAVVATTLTWFTTRPAPPRIVRTTIATSGSAALTLSGAYHDIAITPDGSRVVYRGNNQLLVRALNQIEPTVLSGLGAARDVFMSPDGQSVGFFDGTAMKRVAIAGGPAVMVTPIPRAEGSRGATWGLDGTIIFATATLATGLQRVSATGGEPTVLTKPDRERGEAYHLYPEFLPGGGAVLFTINPVGGTPNAPVGGTPNAQIAVLDLQTGTSKVLIRGGSDAHYVPTGHLVYAVNGTLRAVAFDLRRLEVVGAPTPVLEGVTTTLTGAAMVAVAADGTLVYVSGVGAFGGQPLTVVSVDREGHASPLPGLPPDSYRDVRVSRDGTRIALATQDDVWIYDRTRAAQSRLTTDAASDYKPLWTPDDQRIIFTSNRAGYPELFSRPADSSGSDELLLARAKDLIDLRADSWSLDGKQLLFTEVSPTFQAAIGQMAIERPSDAKMLVKNEFYNDFADISPDGRWMAFESNVSGQYEIYIERYPELGHRQKISTSGGRLPRWSGDGQELFFGSPDNRQILTVPVQSGTTLVAGRSRVLFDFPMAALTGNSRRYDVAPDGRFVIIRGGEAEAGGGTSTQIVLVQNWFEELKRLVPTK